MNECKEGTRQLSSLKPPAGAFLVSFFSGVKKEREVDKTILISKLLNSNKIQND